MTAPRNASPRPEPEIPLNILLLMTDQHRADYLDYLPGGKVDTPNINRIAEGTAFSNCVTVNPICTPARTALLTGKYTHQIGMLAMSGDLDPQHPTFLRALQHAGYFTAGVGKFHWLQGWPWHTEIGKGHDLVKLKSRMMEFGFDYLWEAAGKQLAVCNYCDYCAHLEKKGILQKFREHVHNDGHNSMDPRAADFTGNPWPFPEEDYVDNVIGDQILLAIENRPRDKPFFIQGSFCGPHKPYDPPKSFLEKVPLDETADFIPPGDKLPPEVRARLFKLRRAYKAMIKVIDAQVGRVLDKLEAEDLLDSTVIFFTSDHGEMLGDHGRMSKMQFWRQSVTVPAAIRHPSHLARTVNDSPVEITDLTATILDIAGIDPIAALSRKWPAFNNIVPCRSVMPIVAGEKRRIREFAFSECRNEWEMIQTHQWKYIRFLHPAKGEPGEMLFDVLKDDRELDNRTGDPDCAEILAWCRARLHDLVDSTPPAQLRWAPVMADDTARTGSEAGRKQRREP